MKLLDKKMVTALESGKRFALEDCVSRRIDPEVIASIAADFADSFAGKEITVVLTAEPSGIAIAYATAALFGAKALYARKRPEQNAYSAEVNSKNNTTLYLPKRYLSKEDRVLIVDDCIARGGIASALIELCAQAGAELVGVGVALEKAYLGAGEKLRARGIRLRSVVSLSADDGALGMVIEKQGKRRTV